MEEMIIQVIMSFIASVGFSMLFNVRGGCIWINGAGGAVSWIVYLLVFGATGNLFWGFFMSTAVVGVLCYSLARIIKKPVTLMLVPMIIPLIPGGLLYNVIYYMMNGESEAARSYFADLVIELTAINLAIIFVATFFGVFYSARKYFLKTKK